MRFRSQGKLCVIVVLAATALTGGWSPLATALDVVPTRSAAGTAPRLFSRNEVYAFLDAAKRAEALPDPMQRCLAYPDPPGSHWPVASVRAYCYYRLQPVISFAELESLIQHQHSAEADQRFASLLQAQFTDPHGKGLFDRAFYEDFYSNSLEVRSTLDAWKRDSPKSPFAFAASGVAYVAAAYAARGDAHISDTPNSNLEAMERLLQEADSDLQQAVALNPRIIPAYEYMVTAGELGLGEPYAAAAASRALTVDPSDLSIYSRLSWAAQPQWGGSLDAMRKVAELAQKHVDANPLLAVMLSKVPIHGINVSNCNCHTADELAHYPLAFDHFTSAPTLRDAAFAAESSGHEELSVVYFSEVIRFDAVADDARFARITGLTNFDEYKWALHEAQGLIAKEPNNEGYVKARGWAYEMLDDETHAAKDYERATTLEPRDPWPLLELANLYSHGQQWNKEWAVADRLVALFPEEPTTWLVRADIQIRQPRPGLKDTLAYYAGHFQGTQDYQKNLIRLRAAVALQDGPAVQPKH